MDIINTSKEWKEKADALLLEKDLVKDLSRFGEVHFTGAYSYNLMMHGDIDISVARESDFSVEEVFEIFKTLYMERKFRSYFIGGDWDDPRKGEEFPKGFYVGLKEKINGERWKFDIWFMSKKEYAGREQRPGFADMTEDQRKLILECKQLRNEKKLSITGQEIYDLVLDGKINSADELLNA